jgi:SAM-dependent methyltransferase
LKKHEPMLAIFAVTFSLLMNEVLLSAIFSVLIGDYNTITAISVALLGLSSSGIVVYSVPRLRSHAAQPGLPYRYLALFVAATVACTVVIMALPINHGDFSYAPSVATDAWKVVAYITAIVPFFCGGLTISTVLAANPERVGVLYFCDLAGAAIGCLAAVIVLGPLGAPDAIIASTLPAALLVAVHAARTRRVDGLAVTAAAALVAIAVLQAAGAPVLDVKRFNTLGEVNRSEYRAFAASGKDLDFARWSLDAWTIIRKPTIPQQWERFRGWGVSDRYDGPVPELALLNYNLRYSTYVTRFDGDFSKISRWLDSDLISIQYQLGRDFTKVLNVGAGGGREVLNALNHGARDVTAVDISDTTIDLVMKDRLREWSGNLYFRDDVKAYADEGRSFVMRSDTRYDLIDFTIVGGTNLEKLDVIKIDDLFTREALHSYLTHLSPGGMFSHVMYNTRSDILQTLRGRAELSLPYIPSVKTLVGLRQTFEALHPDARFRDHVLIAGLHGVVKEDYDLVHIIVSASPFTADEVARFERLNEDLNFVQFYPARPGARTIYADVVDADSLASLEAKLPFTIRPSTDDRPFHYAFNPAALRTPGQWAAAILSNPLVANGFVFLCIAAVFLFGPLLLTGSGERGDAPAKGLSSMLVYFAAIGCAYMLIEISLLLKIQLYLGKPVYTLGVALFAFLLSSGLGSVVSSRLDPRRPLRQAALAAAGIVVYGLLLETLWPGFQESTIAYGSLARGAIIVAIVFPLAFPMGMFFPQGIRMASDRHRAMIPWFWAVNGCLSIVGIFASRIVGLFLGFGMALTLGLALYVFTVACLALYVRQARPRLAALAA